MLLLRFFTFFTFLFKIQKTWLFTFFCCVSYVFSNNDRQTERERDVRDRYVELKAMDSEQVRQIAAIPCHLMTSRTDNDSCRLCWCTESLADRLVYLQRQPRCIHLYLHTDTHTQTHRQGACVTHRPSWDPACYRQTKKVNGIYSSTWKTISELRADTCHMASHIITWHPTQVKRGFKGGGTGVRPLNLQQTTWTLSCRTLLTQSLPFCQPDQQYNR